jgi:hypothetical protein
MSGRSSAAKVPPRLSSKIALQNIFAGAPRLLVAIANPAEAFHLPETFDR